MILKKCRVCRNDLPITHFSKHPTTKDKLQNICKSCHSVYYKTYMEEKRKVDPKYKKGSATCSPKLRWYIVYKTSLKCLYCDETHPACLEFHHRDPSLKIMSINRMVSGGGYSIGEVKNEIAKCDVVCANCHRKIHYKGEWYGRQ